VTRAATQTQLEQALTRLLAGQPTSSDGTLTVSSLCREAGVGRDSYYRSPQQFKDTVAAAFTRREAQQPELVALREEIAALKRQRKETDRDHARVVRELESTIRIYANQIQVLALRNAELENQLDQLVDRASDVIQLRT
jgi:transposase-like protein